MQILELIPWVIAILAAVHALFTKDAWKIHNFTMLFFVATFAYFSYQSLFNDVKVGSFYNILPLHLALLLFLGLIFFIKKEVTYKIMSESFDNGMFYGMSIGLVLAGISFFIGSAFLGYGYYQYFVSALSIAFPIAYYCYKKGYGLWATQIISTIVLFLGIACYLAMSFDGVGSINYKYIYESVSRFSPPMLICLFFFLAVLANYNLIKEKPWGHLFTISMSIVSLGFLTHHPEIVHIAKPIVKETLQLATATGGGTVAVISLDVVMKAKTGLG